MNKPICETITLATAECAKAVEEIFNKYNFPASIAVMIIDSLRANLLEGKVQEIVIMHEREEKEVKKEYEAQIEKLKKDLSNSLPTANSTAEKSNGE